MTPRLHVLLGEGGVGKTTLAAGYAIALAQRGRHVGLLSIDPARRLQGALGLTLHDEETPVARHSRLHAAMLVPEVTLRRWATEGLVDERARARLLGNRFFGVVADRLASTTDVIAAGRIAEWRDRDPTLTDLVIDTAPGRNGIELVRRPAALLAFFEGRLLKWLGHLGDPHRGEHAADGIAARALRGLGTIGGMQVLFELADLASAGSAPIHRLIARLEKADAWLHAESTEIFVVTTVRDDAVPAAARIRDVLRDAGLAPTAALVNRTLPPALANELARTEEPRAAEAAAIVHYAHAYIEMQARVIADAASLAPAVIAVPSIRGLEEENRLETLARVGHFVDDALLARNGNART